MKTLLATLLLLFPIFSFGEIKSNISSSASTTLNSIAALHASKVLLQHTCEMAPALGGTETVFQWKEVRYTLWIWTEIPSKNNTLKTPIKWARIYFRDASTTGIETLWSIEDANLDGTIDSGLAPDKLRTLFPCLDISLLKSLGLENMPHFSPELTAKSKEDKLAEWQKKYEQVLGDLNDFLSYIKKKQP